MKNILYPIIVISYIFFMAGCAGRNAAPAAGGSHSEHARTEACDEGHTHDVRAAAEGRETGDGHLPGGEEFADEIIFPASQAARVDLKVEKIGLSSFREVIKSGGDIMAAQGDAQTVVAPVAGVVSYPQARLAPGMRVAKGDVLFYVSSRNVAGGDAAEKARAAYESARAAFERAENLLPDRIVSQQEYDSARREYLSAKSEWEALSAGSTDRGSAVRAPSAGYVAAISVSEGEFAEVGQPLAVVSRNARQQLVARVPERYYTQLPKIRSANIVASDGGIVRLDQRNGKLISVGRSLEAGSALIPVTFEFDAHPAVIPGSATDVYMLGAEREGVLAVPVGALTESQGTYFVYEQVDEEGYVRHEVGIGASDGERVEILSGLEPGRNIVTRGAVHVRMAGSSSIPHSHQH